MKTTFTTLLTSAFFIGAAAFGQDGGEPAAEEKAPAKAAEPAPAPAAPQFEGETKEIGSYFMGYQAGFGLVRLLGQQGIQGLKVEDLDEAALITGLKESLNGIEPSMDMQKSMTAVQALQAKLAQRNAELAEANKKAGDAYRAGRADEEGMVTTDSGLMYKVKTKGEGETYEAPASGQMDMQTRFKVRYAGRLIDGTEFDSSGAEAVTFDLRVVPGFAEALRMMPEGSTWELILKPELAYGDLGSGSTIQPGSTLVFDLTLEKIMKPAPPQPRGEAVTPPIQIPPAPQKDAEKMDK